MTAQAALGVRASVCGGAGQLRESLILLETVGGLGVPEGAVCPEPQRRTVSLLGGH